MTGYQQLTYRQVACHACFNAYLQDVPDAYKNAMKLPSIGCTPTSSFSMRGWERATITSTYHIAEQLESLDVKVKMKASLLNLYRPVSI